MKSEILGDEVGSTMTNSKEGLAPMLWRNNMKNIDSCKN